MNVTYHVYRNIVLNAAGASDEEIAERERNNEEVRRLRYSLVALAWDQRDAMLYVGTTSGCGDILIRFDPRKKAFESCGYGESGLYDPTEHKIHRGLWIDQAARAIYFGTATLADMPQLIASAGGSILRYDIAAGRFQRIARPTPGCFYQATGYDAKRSLIYLYSLPDLGFGVYDLQKKKLRRHHAMESIPHIGCIDAAGGAWGTYGFSEHAFFRYDPDRDAFDFYPKCRFPNAYEASNIMYRGAGPIDSFLDGGDGYLYVASALAELYRLDPRTQELRYLGKPFTGKRCSGMAIGDDGAMYLCGGYDFSPELVRYDRHTNAFENLGTLRASDGETCYRCHDLLVHGRTAYAVETDNPKRSGFIWECTW